MKLKEIKRCVFLQLCYWCKAMQTGHIVRIALHVASVSFCPLLTLYYYYYSSEPKYPTETERIDGAQK